MPKEDNRNLNIPLPKTTARELTMKQDKAPENVEQTPSPQYKRKIPRREPQSLDPNTTIQRHSHHIQKTNQQTKQIKIK